MQQFPPAICCFKRQQSDSFSSSDSANHSSTLNSVDRTDPTEREPTSELREVEPIAESLQLEQPEAEELKAIMPAENAESIFNGISGYVWPTNPGFDDTGRNSVLRTSDDRATDARKVPRDYLGARREYPSRRFKQRDLSESPSDVSNAPPRYGNRFAPDRTRMAPNEKPNKSASPKYAKHKRRKYTFQFSDDGMPDDRIGYDNATPCPCSCHHRNRSVGHGATKSRRDKGTARNERPGSVEPPSDIDSPTPSEQRWQDLNEHWAQRKAYSDKVNNRKRRPAEGWELTKNVLIIVFAVTVVWHAFMLRFFFISRLLSILHQFLVLTGAAHADYERYAEYLKQMR